MVWNRIETQSNSDRNTTHTNMEQTQAQGEKNECRDYKENLVRKENHITISQELRLESSQGRNWKDKLLLTHTPTNNITELNELIYAGTKLVCTKIGVPRKNTDGNSKLGWKIRLETQIRNLRQQVKMLKQTKKAKICWDEKEKKNNTFKTNDATQGNKSEGTGERKKTKKISRQGKTIQMKQNIPKQKEIYHQVGLECAKTYQQPEQNLGTERSKQNSRMDE